MKTLIEVLKVARPVHWVKNFALFAALIFSGNLFADLLVGKILLAFVSFSFVTSAGYIFNDILDVEKDRRHPIKKQRPIAARRLSTTSAITAMFAFLVSSLLIASGLNNLFFFSVAGYAALQTLYSLVLKNLPIIDILVIAAGFVIRVYAGAFVVDAHLSVWFLLCVVSVALFIASGKRRAELGALPAGKTRETLTKYHPDLLNSYVTMFGNAAWLSWALFAFFESPSATTPVWLFLAEISRTTTVSKLLMLTIPIAIFGIMRYESLIFENRSESPEKLLLTDKPLVASIALWVGIVIAILYGGIATHS